MTQDEAAWAWPAEMVGLPVIDVNGTRVGRVAALRASGKIEVALDEREVTRDHAPARVVRVPFDEIVNVDDHEVTLREEARFVLHPEAMPDPRETAF